jgi:DNA polymerase-3 subunit beta
MTANDMELGIETVISGKIEEPGMIALSARLFSDIIRKLPESEVCIEVRDNFNTVIQCEKAKFLISGKDGEDFVRIPMIERDTCVSLSQFTLKEMILQTLFSTAANDTNKIMTGELFEINENVMRVVSLDGHRISLRRVMLKEASENRKVIVPGKTLSEISKILSGETEDIVNLYFAKNQIMFEFDETIVVSRLIEGNYFRVDQMLSNDFETKITVRKTALSSAVDRALLFTSEADKRPLVFTIGQDVMNMKIVSPVGSMSDDVEIEMEGKELKIGFNPKFILDVLRVIDSDEILIYFLNSKAPCFIRDEAQSYIYMVLPVNFV